MVDQKVDDLAILRGEGGKVKESSRRKEFVRTKNRIEDVIKERVAHARAHPWTLSYPLFVFRKSG